MAKIELWPACLSLLVLLVIGSGGLACTGTETGNPSFEGELSYDAYSSEPARAALREGEQGAVIEQAWLVLGDVTFVDNNHCAEPARAEGHADGLGAGDHAPLDGARTRFWLAIGQYCGLRLPFERAGKRGLPKGAPPELSGHSIVLAGRLPEREDMPFLIASKLERTVELLPASSFELGPDDARLLLGFDLGAWLEGVELDAIAPDEDGRVLITADTQPDLIERFEDNVAAGVGVYFDPDATGMIDDAGERIAQGE